MKPLAQSISLGMICGGTVKLHPETPGPQSSEVNGGPQSEMSDGAPNQAIQAWINASATTADLVEDSGTTSGHRVVLLTIVRMWVSPWEGAKVPPGLR
ncbi:hypothetical protein AAFF_G00352110 [Aldrovandia affinis]|uniref:Uncharacterized protein n=1 Tax=Aldrovandia affinis TaxID=143900 RepID=A0AAD7WPC8_9TELE|nr:hypothetical protein AAFF_G00352110 [Aldrovandia affinis]